ncbi:cotranscriptional regulator FAM172A homolog, partial [Conger conger]|uniref:cotranscriptional regulator FAM172A homolog n=1 Tax=Conger conger TaxID=82655 RepID=UPI002A5A273E
PAPAFPYRFDREGRLLHRHTGAPFLFRLGRGEEARRAAEQLEALWSYITQHVHLLLQEDWHLRRLALPPPARGLVWVSQGALESRGRLLLLLQDRGVARSGQWSWRAIAGGGLEAGSQIPYVRRARQEGWGVALLDPNEEGASPEEHLRHAWDGLLAGAGAGQVAVATHGYGGLAFVDLLARRPQEVQRLVCAVAFIDSAHSLWHQPLSADARDWLRAHSRKWVLSGRPLNRAVSSLRADGPQVSAGTLRPEHAPAACLHAVFRYMAKALRAAPAPTPYDIVTRSRSQGRSRPPAGGARPRHSNANNI